MIRTLPPHPDLKYLRQEAKLRLRILQEEKPSTILADAQFAIAREYGFASWPKLKHHVEQRHTVDQRIASLRVAFAEANEAGRTALLKGVHSRERFSRFREGDLVLTEDDARLVVANEEGYAFWSKYDSYLNLDEHVRRVISAVRQGDLSELQSLLTADASGANPHWVTGTKPSGEIPNDSVPLFCVAEGVFTGSNRQANDYALTKALIDAGAEVDIENGLPLSSAISFNAAGCARALLEAGALPDGPQRMGFPLAFALYFGFTSLADMLAAFGARLDLRFAAGQGAIDLMEGYFANGALSDPVLAGELGDPYENRFRCSRTASNVLSQSLFFACMNSRLTAMEYLLDRGADASAVVPGLDMQATPLHWLTTIAVGRPEDASVVEKSRLSAVKLLLDRGAQLDVKDPRYHSTPLGWAEHLGRSHMSRLMNQYRRA